MRAPRSDRCRRAVTVTRHRAGDNGASPHAGKFRVAIATLVGIAVASIIVAVAALSSHTDSAQTMAWSPWSPSDGGLSGAREIADFISPLYRISGTDQLAVVTVVNLANARATSASGTVNGLQVAVQTSSSSSAVSLLSGNTIAYNLCGLGGSNCAIGVGTPSSQRLLLLRREALELSLYTFKYIKGTQNVVVALPPGRSTQTTCTGICAKSASTTTKSTPIDIAVLLERQAMQPLLDQPLSFTFPEQFPPTVSQVDGAPEAGLVEQVTARGLFTEQLVQAQDGSNLIVLNPLPPQ